MRLFERKTDRHSEIDHVVAQELELFDRLIAGETHPTDSPAGLDELVRALRDNRPLPGGEFAGSLDAKVAARFRDAAETEVNDPMKSIWRRFQDVGLAPALGAAASLLVVASIGVGVLTAGGGSDDAAKGGQSAVGEQTSNQVGDAGVAEELSLRKRADSMSQSAGAVAGDDTSTRELSKVPASAFRQVEKTASLDVAVPNSELDSAADKVISITDRFGGFVGTSTVTAGDGEGHAEFQLKLPAAKFDQALADLSAIGHIRARTQNTNDVTAQYRSTTSRLREAKAERQGLLRALAKATTNNEVASIRARLGDVNRRIARLNSARASIQNRVNYVSLAVTITGSGKSNASTDSWSLGDAASDALHALTVMLGVLLIGLAIGLPIALIVATIWIGVSSLRRRSRDRVVSGDSDGS